MGTLKFTPTNEIQTREWFAAHISDSEYSIVESRSAFPDYVLEIADGTRYRVEAESVSDNFIRHKHDARGCDFVLCWKHNSVLPVPVLELSTGKWFGAGVKSPDHYNETTQNTIKKRERNKAQFIDKIRALCAEELVQEYITFVQAYATSLKAQSQYLKAVQPSRLELIVVTTELCRAIRGRGVEIERVAPEDLFAWLHP